MVTGQLPPGQILPPILANFWFLMLLPQLGSGTHSPLPAPPPGMYSRWGYVCCLGIMQMHSRNCLRLICIAFAVFVICIWLICIAWLGVPLSRFLEGALHKFLNE